MRQRVKSQNVHETLSLIKHATTAVSKRQHQHGNGLCTDNEMEKQGQSYDEQQIQQL